MELVRTVDRAMVAERITKERDAPGALYVKEEESRELLPEDTCVGNVSAPPLIERKALFEPLVADKLSLQFNGPETGDGNSS